MKIDGWIDLEMHTHIYTYIYIYINLDVRAFNSKKGKEEELFCWMSKGRQQGQQWSTHIMIVCMKWSGVVRCDDGRPSLIGSEQKFSDAPSLRLRLRHRAEAFSETREKACLVSLRPNKAKE